MAAVSSCPGCERYPGRCPSCDPPEPERGHVMQLTSPPRGEWPTDLVVWGRVPLWSPRALCRCKGFETDDCATADEARDLHAAHVQSVAP